MPNRVLLEEKVNGKQLLGFAETLALLTEQYPSEAEEFEVKIIADGLKHHLRIFHDKMVVFDHQIGT